MYLHEDNHRIDYFKLHLVTLVTFFLNIYSPFLLNKKNINKLCYINSTFKYNRCTLCAPVKSKQNNVQKAWWHCTSLRLGSWSFMLYYNLNCTFKYTLLGRKTISVICTCVQTNHDLQGQLIRKLSHYDWDTSCDETDIF